MTKPTPISEGAVFDLAAIDRELQSDASYLRDGHAARTLVREPAIRIVLVVMKAGARIAEHRAQEVTSIQALTGHVRLVLSDRALDLAGGRVLVVAPDLRHHVEAVADSALLLTLAWCERG
jgi:quercetin dioxygenase-like cupin family protein